MCAAALAMALGACDEPESQENDVIVRTESEAEWRQYVRNVEFAGRYEARCRRDPASSRPHVIVTGFGRFLENRENATGRMVSELVPGLEYPLTDPPAEGEVDDPEAQTRVVQSTITLEGLGEVEVCGMVLPVFWDVAAILVLRESASFLPDFVLMNGIAGSRQPLWLELGSVNAAVALPDGSGNLQPIEPGTKLVEEASEEEHARGLLLSYHDVRAAVEARLNLLAPELGESGVSFGELLTGVRFAGFPRPSNTYLCNNTTYAMNYLFDHPYETVRLLRASHPRPGGPDGIDVALGQNLARTPRVFVHWPKDLAGSHLGLGADLMAEIVRAQLSASEEPLRGDPALADL